MNSSDGRAAEIALILHRELKRRRLLGKAAECAGRDRSYFTDALTRKGGLEVGPWLAALETLGVHPVVFLQEHFEATAQKLAEASL